MSQMPQSIQKNISINSMKEKYKKFVFFSEKVPSPLFLIATFLQGTNLEYRQTENMFLKLEHNSNPWCNLF